jgi:hypothetical protein
MLQIQVSLTTVTTTDQVSHSTSAGFYSAGHGWSSPVKRPTKGHRSQSEGLMRRHDSGQGECRAARCAFIRGRLLRRRPQPP